MDDAWDCGYVHTFRLTDCGKNCPEQPDQGTQATRYQLGPCPSCSRRLQRAGLVWTPGMQHVEDVLTDNDVIIWDTLQDLGLEEVKGEVIRRKDKCSQFSSGTQTIESNVWGQYHGIAKEKCDRYQFQVEISFKLTS
jgi:hypothetical protein